MYQDDVMFVEALPCQRDAVEARNLREARGSNSAFSRYLHLLLKITETTEGTLVNLLAGIFSTLD